MDTAANAIFETRMILNVPKSVRNYKKIILFTFCDYHTARDRIRIFVLNMLKYKALRFNSTMYCI